MWLSSRGAIAATMLLIAPLLLMKEKQFEPVAVSPIPYLTWVVGISSLILFGCSSLRHALFQSTALDLAFFDQLVYLVSQGLPPISSIFGFHLLGDHAAFILYPIALLYKIYPDVHWLFAVQALALAAGAMPIYALSVQSGLSVTYARAIALSYLLYPALFNINFYTDFRPEAIAVPALLWAMWAGIASRTGQFIIAVVLVLSCKDILSLTVIALGIWFALFGHRRLYGWGCIAVGTIWFVFAIGYLVPMLRGGQPGGVGFYSSIGGSFSEVAWKVLTNPGVILGRFLLPDRLFYYLLLILPVIIGLSWRQIAIMLPALPMLLLNILSDFSAQRDLIHHYSLPIFPFILIWLIRSLSHYQQQHKRRWLNSRLLIIWAAIIFLALAKYDYFLTRYLSGLSNIKSVRAAVDLVQPQERVLSTTHIGPHLSHRPILKIINKNLDIEQSNSNTFDCIILDLQHPGTGISLELMDSWLERLKNSPVLKLSYQHEGVFLFKRASTNSFRT
ncbi:MAG TPA: DUF2079 domain-containing protein [Candidatus Sericytochromatia bacterium]